MKKKLIGTILTLLCTGVVAFSGWQVYKIMSEYQSGEKVYLELEEYVSPPTEEKNTDHQTESSESENKTILPVVEFEKLKSINNDFVAWIYCEGTAINYPVVHYKDNTYYLKHMFDGSYNSAGCIFLDCRNSSDFTDENNIIAKAVSSELQKLLGRCFYCIASMDDHDYWGISIQNDRVDLAELDFVFDTVEAEDRVREDTYCDDGDVSFNALGMGLSDLLLKRSLGLDWIKEYIDREFLYLIDVKEKDSDDMSHIQLENLGVDLKQLRSMSQLLIYTKTSFCILTIE